MPARIAGSFAWKARASASSATEMMPTPQGPLGSATGPKAITFPFCSSPVQYATCFSIACFSLGVMSMAKLGRGGMRRQRKYMGFLSGESLEAEQWSHEGPGPDQHLRGRPAARQRAQRDQQRLEHRADVRRRDECG